VSHCANYVLVCGGERITANTRWGAPALPANVFWGPEETFDFVLSLADADDPSSRLLYGELMCEGAVFADYDRERLLIYGGEDLRYEKPQQHLFIEMLRLAWPGWRADWAYGGWGQVATEAGVAVDPYLLDYVRTLQYAWKGGLDWPADRLAAIADEAGVRPRLDENDRFPDSARPDRWDPQTERGIGPIVLVTTREPGGAVADRAVRMTEQWALALGPLLAEWVAEHPPVDPTPNLHCAKAGVYVDREPGEMHYWMGVEEPSWLPDMLAAAWPGWSVARNEAAVTGHFLLSGRDPAPVRIDPAVLRRDLLGNSFGIDSHAGLDAMVAELAERAARPGVTVAPGALRNPRPAIGADTRQRRLAEILALLP
jgi:hypothetical protein